MLVYIWIASLESCAYKSSGILFKSLIANMAGILLWLSITNIMIEVFKVASAQWLLFYQWVWFILQRNSPKSLQAYDRYLGAALFKLRLHQIHKSHVAASMHHDTWGANAKSSFAHLIEDPTHHIVMSRPLGLPIALVKNSRYTSLNPLYWRIHCSVGKVQSS